MKKRDVIIIAVVLAAALLGAGAVWLLSPKGPASTVRIYVNSVLYREVPLDEDQIVEIDQGSGVVNRVEIKDGSARMLDSTCPDQLCVGFGPMSEDNWETRVMRNWIVCLPHRVEVELVIDEGGGS